MTMMVDSGLAGSLAPAQGASAGASGGQPPTGTATPFSTLMRSAASPASIGAAPPAPALPLPLSPVPEAGASVPAVSASDAATGGEHATVATAEPASADTSLATQMTQYIEQMARTDPSKTPAGDAKPIMKPTIKRGVEDAAKDEIKVSQDTDNKDKNVNPVTQLPLPATPAPIVIAPVPLAVVAQAAAPSAAPPRAVRGSTAGESSQTTGSANSAAALSSALSPDVAGFVARLASVEAPAAADGDAASIADLAPSATAAPPAATSPSPAAPLALAMPTGQAASNVGTMLGQQVIDMGASGQWIDGLAREIVALSKSEGQGSFRLSPAHLGPMRVDIRPGDQGARVTLTVETKAAEAMLVQDRHLLKADAQLSAVRIHDVTVERVAHVAEIGRTDASTGQGMSGQNGGQGTAAQQATLAQSQGQAGQSGNNGNNGGNRKVPDGETVSSQAEPRDQGDTAPSDVTRRARYA